MGTAGRREPRPWERSQTLQRRRDESGVRGVRSPGGTGVRSPGNSHDCLASGGLHSSEIHEECTDSVPREPKQWLSLKGVGHNDLELVSGARYFEALARFLEEHLDK